MSALRRGHETEEEEDYEDPDLAARWEILKERFAPVFDAGTLAAVLATIFLFLVVMVGQFATTLFDAHAHLGTTAWALVALLSAFITASTARRRSAEAPHLSAMAIFGLLTLLSGYAAVARLSYHAGLDGDASYTLPHAPVAYQVKTETITLRTSDGVRLTGLLLANNHPKALVLYPGWRATKSSFAVATLAQWLANSYDVLVLDPRGQGDSEGAHNPEGHDKLDLLAAVAYLKGAGRVAVGVIAETEGCYPALLAAGMQQGMDSLAVLSPTGTWGESFAAGGISPRNPVGRVFWRVTAGVRTSGGADGPLMVDAVHKVAPVPLLLIASEKDPLANQFFMAAGEPRSLIMLGGEGQPLRWPRFADYYEALKQWFTLTLHEPK